MSEVQRRSSGDEGTGITPTSPQKPKTGKAADASRKEHIASQSPPQHSAHQVESVVHSPILDVAQMHSMMRDSQAKLREALAERDQSHVAATTTVKMQAVDQDSASATAIQEYGTKLDHYLAVKKHMGKAYLVVQPGSGSTPKELAKFFSAPENSGLQADKAACKKLLDEVIRNRIVFALRDLEEKEPPLSPSDFEAGRQAIISDVTTLFKDFAEIDKVSAGMKSSTLESIVTIGKQGGHRPLTSNEAHVIENVKVALGFRKSPPAEASGAPKATQQEIRAADVSAHAASERVAKMSVEEIRAVFSSGKERDILAVINGSSGSPYAVLEAIVDLPTQAFTKPVQEAIDKSRLLHTACRSFYPPPSVTPHGDTVIRPPTDFELVSKNIQICAKAAEHLINNLPEDSLRVSEIAQIPLQHAQKAAEVLGKAQGVQQQDVKKHEAVVDLLIKKTPKEKKA